MVLLITDGHASTRHQRLGNKNPSSRNGLPHLEMLAMEVP